MARKAAHKKPERRLEKPVSDPLVHAKEVVKYRSLFEDMSQGCFFQDGDGVLVEANQSALKMLGLTMDQFTGKDSKDPALKVINEDGSEVPTDQYPSMVALRTGEKVLDKVLGVFNHELNDYVWLVINAFPQFERGRKTPVRVLVIMHDITKNKAFATMLTKTNEELEIRIQERTNELEKKNIALSEILSQIELEKQNIARRVDINVQRLLLPVVEKLTEKASTVDKRYLRLLKQNLEDITSSMGARISSDKFSLTPKEMELCALIKGGFSIKEIAVMHNLSERTVETHRFNIRKKLGINSKKINLSSYLSQVS